MLIRDFGTQSLTEEDRCFNPAMHYRHTPNATRGTRFVGALRWGIDPFVEAAPTVVSACWARTWQGPIERAGDQFLLLD